MTANKNVPKVSIILPAYNTERYLSESIDSVRRQSFTDFELIIINDGSTDGTQRIIDDYAARDERIISLKQKNQGLVATLNKAVKMARGMYIARIDGDDPWMDDKLSAQVDSLDKNLDVSLIGGGFEIIDENGFFIETIHALTRDEDIRRAMMLRNPFGHAGVMFRKDAFDKVGGYSNSHGPTEDFELWIRLATVGRLANLPKPVYRYRIVDNGISQSNSALQMKHTNIHIASLWEDHTPRLLTRNEIRKQANRYLHIHTRKSYAIGMKEQFLSDNAQIGIKLIRHGHFIKGFLQLCYVASIGRSGLRAVKKRFLLLDRGSIKQLSRSR